MPLPRQLGAYNTVWRIQHKLMQGMVERSGRQRLQGRVQLDDAGLGGERSGGKWGRGAEGKTPFVAAVQTPEEGRSQYIKLNVVQSVRKSHLADWAGRHLVAGSEVVSDGLQGFDGVTQAGRSASGCSQWGWAYRGGEAGVLLGEYRA